MDKNFQDWFKELPIEEQKRRKEQMAKMQPPAWMKKWGLTAIVLIILFFGVLVFRPWVTVDTDEVGVVLRLGKFNRTLGPGFHLRLPPPVELIYTPKVTQIKRIEIGFRTVGNNQFQDVEDESYMLTGDENIASVELVVQYRISDPAKYLFTTADVEETVKDITESAMRKVVGDYPIDAVLTDRRAEIANKIREEIQILCDDYNLGVTLQTQVQLQTVDVPPEVQPAFRQVVSARENQIRYVNEAEGYSNSEIPKAEGKVQELLQEAEAYRVKRIAEAQGSVERFAAVLREYEAAPEVTKTRLYFETMEKVLEGKPKMIIGTESQGDVLKFLNVSPGMAPALPVAPNTQGGQ